MHRLVNDLFTCWLDIHLSSLTRGLTTMESKNGDPYATELCKYFTGAY
jgi:hypothetical protein